MQGSPKGILFGTTFWNQCIRQVSWNWKPAKDNAPPDLSYQFSKDQLIARNLVNGDATVMLWNKSDSLSLCQQDQMLFLVANEDVILYWEEVKQDHALPAETINVPTSADQKTNIYVGRHAGRVGTIESTELGKYDFVVYTASNKSILETPDCDFEVLCAKN